MRIYEYSPFLHEHRALEIKAREAAKWIDAVHLGEADQTFSGAAKPCNFRPFSSQHPELAPLGTVVHHWLKTEGLFRRENGQAIFYDPKRCGRARFDEWYWALLTGNSAYHNEAVQRNLAAVLLRDVVCDEDVVILSDVDEVLDSRFAARIVEETRRRGIITVKLHYSVFYLNLFTTINHGVADFSYRTFVMTGRYFRTMPFTPDYLRKRGIEGGFLDEIHCPAEHLGFHHSWLEHERNGLAKLKAFEDNVEDKSIFDAGYLRRCIADRRLHYLDADLYVDDSKPFLGALAEMDTSGLWLDRSSNPDGSG